MAVCKVVWPQDHRYRNGGGPSAIDTLQAASLVFSRPLERIAFRDDSKSKGGPSQARCGRMTSAKGQILLSNTPTYCTTVNTSLDTPRRCRTHPAAETPDATGMQTRLRIIKDYPSTHKSYGRSSTYTKHHAYSTYNNTQRSDRRRRRTYDDEHGYSDMEFVPKSTGSDICPQEGYEYSKRSTRYRTHGEPQSHYASVVAASSVLPSLEQVKLGSQLMADNLPPGYDIWFTDPDGKVRSPEELGFPDTSNGQDQSWDPANGAAHSFPDTGRDRPWHESQGGAPPPSASPEDHSWDPPTGDGQGYANGESEQPEPGRREYLEKVFEGVRMDWSLICYSDDELQEMIEIMIHIRNYCVPAPRDPSCGCPCRYYYYSQNIYSTTTDDGSACLIQLFRIAENAVRARRPKRATNSVKSAAEQSYRSLDQDIESRTRTRRDIMVYTIKPEQTAASFTPAAPYSYSRDGHGTLDTGCFDVGPKMLFATLYHLLTLRKFSQWKRDLRNPELLS
ncbi:hypothetical protein HD553DRAFT_325435 [Filobasidium floriforme]|uniref:uncharacterized protein n=1 Tax=Filobasidium floriforme TaxID=5210 RepID=UPI001E8D13F1|nr:uncharacterized protein HD553DRAFT_325435 [Filobasidium floriforme]KAH8081397.1 hypothetical protein HD553DRAFT_325435 [Filobasidium floriforme]